MPLDFPSNPSDGQVYDDYYYDATVGAWQSNNGTQVPNIFKNVEYTTAQTYLTPVTVKGKLGQTADLQQWTDGAGNVLASLDEQGNMTVNSLISIQPIATVPTGSILPYAGSTAPNQFLLCQGQAVSRSTYSNLFAVLGTTYGSGDGSTTFNLPNPTGRVIAGKSSSGTFSNLGATGGSETHTLSISEMPSHTHIQDSHNHSQNAHNHGISDPGHSHVIRGPVWRESGYNVTMRTDGGAGQSVDQGARTNTDYTGISVSNNTATNNATTATNQNTGGGGAHNNLQPYLVTNYIIKT